MSDELTKPESCSVSTEVGCLDGEERIRAYATMTGESFKIESGALVASLNAILDLYQAYFGLIKKCENELGVFNLHMIPVIDVKQQELAGLYEKLDNLEMYVNKLKRDHDELEKRMDAAERKLELGKMDRLKRMIDDRLSRAGV